MLDVIADISTYDVLIADAALTLHEDKEAAQLPLIVLESLVTARLLGTAETVLPAVEKSLYHLLEKHLFHPENV